MAKAEPQLDVLVLGEHPSTFLAATLLRRSRFRVLHSLLPSGVAADRLVVVNPKLFDLDKSLAPLKRKVDLEGIYGAQFLGPTRETRSEHHSRSIMVAIASYREMRSAMHKLAEEQGVEFAAPKSLEIHRLDEQGIEVSVGRASVRPRVLVVGQRLKEEQLRLLGVPDAWDAEILQRYTYAKVRSPKGLDLGPRPVIPMSLDVDGSLGWAWLLPGHGQVQVAVMQPVTTLRQSPPQRLLARWLATLKEHEVVPSSLTLPLDSVESFDMPLAGALAQEGVANRTLLIGPAGGFYSATGEEMYPACWSAVHAADVVRKALKEKHLQDALQPYRHKWRTTLGDYLRGPQQNLRLLLPLVYRNQVMTSRLVESILTGRSVVR
jgi:flavin-dependent dehydrogenase